MQSDVTFPLRQISVKKTLGDDGPPDTATESAICGPVAA